MSTCWIGHIFGLVTTEEEGQAHDECTRAARHRHDGARDGPTVITVFSLVFAVALFGIAIGVHTAQSWLEHWSYTKHFGD